MVRWVLVAEVSGERVRGRPRLGGMDGVKTNNGQQRNDGGGCATMRERSERVENPGTYEAERVSRGHIAWQCVLSDRPPVFLWLSPGEGWDAVTNCKKGETTENQGADVKYKGQGRGVC